MATTTTTTSSSTVSPGIKTTEFILTTLVSIYAVVQGLLGHLSPNASAIIVAAVVGVYTIMRTVLKILDPGFTAPDLPGVVITQSVGSKTTTEQATT